MVMCAHASTDANTHLAEHRFRVMRPKCSHRWASPLPLCSAWLCIWLAASASGLWVRKLKILTIFCNLSVLLLLAMRVTSCFSPRLLRNTIAGLLAVCPLPSLGVAPTSASNLLLSLLILVQPNSSLIGQTKRLCATHRAWAGRALREKRQNC